MPKLKSISIAVVVLLAIGLLPVGCAQVDRFNDPYLSNNTETPLDILYVHNGQTTPLGLTAVAGALSPLSLFRDGCSDGTLIAVDPSGTEVARYDKPLCAGETWTIGSDPSPSP